MKLLITGGHITPALAVIDDCLREKIEIVFVGRDYSYDKNSPTMESKMVKEKNVKFVHLDAGRMPRVFNFQTIKHLITIPKGFISAYQIIKNEKPDKILTFGGYLGFPVSIIGFFLKIPIYIHEQVMVPGITNRIISRFAKKVFVSFPESISYFPKNNTLVTGNPLRKSIYVKSRFKVKVNKPVLYVTGGSLGSHELNLHIEAILPELLKTFVVIHQTGNVKQFDDFARLSAYKHNNYFVFDHILEEDIGSVFESADIVVSRSGANTVFELMALHKLSVLIPLPYSGFGEQQRQAELLESHNVARIFQQTDSSQLLFKTIMDVYNNRDKMKPHFSKLSSYILKDSSKIILHRILDDTA